ncbi:Rid family hydrolase [Streptomyces sp. NPDC052040]|uniref:Rid family hydrolase n=1 Tax=unclassified Streptomyces TaxID=2593676 RepID=UPI0037D27010
MTVHAVEPVEVPEGNAVFGETTSAFASFGYSAAVRAHGLLFIAGTIGRRADGTIPDTIEEQTEIAIRKIEEILRLENLDPSALVDVTSYHVDIREHLTGFIEVKQRLVKAPYPGWTIIGVSGLASPGLLVEIRATAAYPGTSR